MATIGLDKLFYADITEDENGNETYGTPKQLAKAISADLSVELNEATLYADDGQAEAVKEFKSGTLSLGVDDIGHDVAAALVGATLDSNGVLISGSDDCSKYVAIGFRAKKANGKYKYYWLYRVLFGTPATNLATKGDSISFQTPTIEGTIFRRNKIDGRNNHPWKAEVTESTTNTTIIREWYNSVYEPDYGVAGGGDADTSAEPASAPAQNNEPTQGNTGGDTGNTSGDAGDNSGDTGNEPPVIEREDLPIIDEDVPL